MYTLTDLETFKQALLNRIDKTRKLMALAPDNKQPLSQALIRKDEMMLAQIEQDIARVAPTQTTRSNL